MRLEPALQSGSLLRQYQALWGPLYEAVLDILGSTAVVLPLGDPTHGQPDATNFTTVGEEQATFTWSEAPAGFDTPLDLRGPDSFQGIMPVVTFNGSDEHATTPDVNYWSLGDGSNDLPFSVGMWIRPTIGSSMRLLEKTTEWAIFVNSSGTCTFRLFDNSESTSFWKDTPAVASGEYVFLVGTYDGSESVNGVKLFLAGADVTTGGSGSGTYIAMENLAIALQFARASNNLQHYEGGVVGGPLGPFFTQVELTADQVLNLYQLGRASLGL